MQQVVNVEFYTTCADVKVIGTSESTADFLSKVSPVVTFSGTDHLPADADAYRKAYNGEFVASLDSEFLVGPAVATYNGEAPPVADPPVVDPEPEQPEVPETPPEEPEQPEDPPEEEDPPVDPPVEEPSEPSEPTDHLMPTAWAAHDSHELTLLRLDEFTSALPSVVGRAATGTTERVVLRAAASPASSPRARLRPSARRRGGGGAAGGPRASRGRDAAGARVLPWLAADV